MEFISRRMWATGTFKQFKAPTGYMYHVHAFLGTVLDVVAGRLVILNRFIEEEIPTTENVNVMFVMECGAIHSSSITLPEPIRCKTISIGGFGSIKAWVVVYYTLEKASTPDLVYEFITRGKSP